MQYSFFFRRHLQQELFDFSFLPLHKIISFSLLVLLGGSVQLQAQRKPPNVVYILADDLGYGDVGCYGQKWIQTPNIDRLASEGMKFTNFYAGSTVCAPSRAALMTGKHTGRVSVRGNGEVPLAKEEQIIPEMLASFGYANGMMGKWGLGLAQNEGNPLVRGWNVFAGHLHHVEGHYQQPDSAWQSKGGSLVPVKIPDGVFANEWFTNEAIRFIDDHQQKPFFLYLSFTLPHAELVVPSSFIAPYRSGVYADHFSPEKPWAPGQHYGSQPTPRAAYAAMVSQMDAYIGMVLQQLKKLKLEDNTIVIFTSDNGTHVEGGRTAKDVVDIFQSSGPFRGWKRDLYEGGIRVPFLVKWPGKIQASSESSVPAAAWDIFPTLEEAARSGVSTKGKEISGAQKNKSSDQKESELKRSKDGSKDAKNINQQAPLDGRSLLSIWQGTANVRDIAWWNERVLYWEFYERGFKQALRKGDWKAIRFFQGNKPFRTELYHLKTDPAEQQDLFSVNPSLAASLVALMEQQRISSTNPLFQIK